MEGRRIYTRVIQKLNNVCGPCLRKLSLYTVATLTVSVIVLTLVVAL